MYQKLVPGPLPVDSSINEEEVSDIFMKFFVKMLKNYRDYLEAPSEYVIDKFDKKRFLEDNEDKSQFLAEFLETQMFQCFVDDRYGDAASQNTKNLEVYT